MRFKSTFNTVLGLFAHFMKYIWRGVKIIFSKIVLFWHAQKYFRYVIGVCAILYGLVALVTPLLPGSWFILVGLELLGLEILFWQRFKIWLVASWKFLRSKGKTIRFCHFREVIVPAIGFIFLNKTLVFAPAVVVAAIK